MTNEKKQFHKNGRFKTPRFGKLSHSSEMQTLMHRGNCSVDFTCFVKNWDRLFVIVLICVYINDHAGGELKNIS